VIFEPDGFTVAYVVQLHPNVIVFAVLLSEIDFVEITEDPFVNVIPTMNVHMITMNHSGMIRSIRDVLTCNLDLRPAGVEMIEIVSLDGQ
jgi:hypothetical protein